MGASEIEGLGVLDTAFPLREVKQILGELKCESRRRRKLPADLMVYYSIALGLMCAVGARQVLRHLLDLELTRFRGHLKIGENHDARKNA
jgi:hypothetical protein